MEALMIDELKRFASDLATNNALKTKLGTIENTPDSVVAFAQSHGYNFTLEDVQQYTHVSEDGELTEAQLETVGGGAWLVYTTTGKGGTSTFMGTKSDGNSFIYTC